MPTGRVKFFNADRGYGFIAPDGGGSDVFVHVHEVEFAGMKILVKGQLLTYNTAPARDGRLKAVDLACFAGRIRNAFTPAASFFANAVMARLIALVIVATALAACAGHVADYIPTWAGGPPKDLPPRPGTPEYDAYRQKMDDEVTRDKSKDPPKPKTDPGIAGLPK
jgi:CspA family cold shock protein